MLILLQLPSSLLFINQLKGQTHDNERPFEFQLRQYLVYYFQCPLKTSQTLDLWQYRDV